MVQILNLFTRKKKQAVYDHIHIQRFSFQLLRSPPFPRVKRPPWTVTLQKWPWNMLGGRLTQNLLPSSRIRVPGGRTETFSPAGAVCCVTSLFMPLLFIWSCTFIVTIWAEYLHIYGRLCWFIPGDRPPGINIQLPELFSRLLWDEITIWITKGLLSTSLCKIFEKTIGLGITWNCSFSVCRNRCLRSSPYQTSCVCPALWSKSLVPGPLLKGSSFASNPIFVNPTWR